MNTSSTERKRDETFWFEDGTIAIVAQNTEFRVYKGQLAQRFPVFKTDLRTFGASATAYEGSLNGGPLVPVLIVADSARDWRHVLTLLLNTTGEQRYATVGILVVYDVADSLTQILPQKQTQSVIRVDFRLHSTWTQV